MSLTASMWTSVSGLLVHGEKMNVIGNNISNVNTVGFKGQRMDFQDYVYQYMGTASGMGQVGRGTSIGIIMNDFDQGALENTTSDTDIAITGNGFFAVKPKTNNTTYYTRAGNFSFDKDGYLVSPHGYVLQGWMIDREKQNTNSSSNINRQSGGIVGTGAPTDIQLDTFTCPPRHTTEVTLPVNLKQPGIDSVTNKLSTDDDKSVDVADPFFAILKRWNAEATKPLGDDSYAFQSTIEVFDEGGQSHELTVYFDRVANGATTGGGGTQNITNNSENEIYWEYIVTMDPAGDVRDFTTNALSPNAISTTADVPDKLKGLLGAGVITFGKEGNIKDTSCFVPGPGQWWDASDNVDLDKFVSAPFSQDGFPMIAPNFSGAPGQASAYGGNGTADYTRANPYAEGHLIALDFGVRNKSNNWSFPTGAPTSMPVSGPGGMAVATADDIGTNKQYTFGLNGAKEDLPTTMTCLGNAYYEHPGKRQDGYTYGDLRYVAVNNQGVLSASYSNGVTLQLFQLTLYDFPSKQNLRREGGNLFTETRESGLASAGAAGTGVFGTTQGRSLEQSNADIAREFVNMITTQRGFQANSKSITTVDSMLETVINMKR